ncbi:unnamed protein product [Clavelina lepadiformis]|uniref:Reverse transcriptase domain-containing protein n=1 Tax=Clavelina lepadiformis TaxID=159417 RepID=A0ABP0FLL8_CLALP
MDTGTAANIFTVPTSTSLPRTARACLSPAPSGVEGKCISIFARYYGVGNLSFFCPIEGCDHSFATSPPLYKHLIKSHGFIGFSSSSVMFEYECNKCKQVLSGKTLHLISNHFKTCDRPDVTNEDVRCRFICPRCDTRWAHASSARAHFRNAHSESSMPTNSGLSYNSSLNSNDSILNIGQSDGKIAINVIYNGPESISSQLFCPKTTCRRHTAAFPSPQLLKRHVNNMHSMSLVFSPSCGNCAMSLPVSPTLLGIRSHFATCRKTMGSPPSSTINFAESTPRTRLQPQTQTPPPAISPINKPESEANSTSSPPSIRVSPLTAVQPFLRLQRLTPQQLALYGVQSTSADPKEASSRSSCNSTSDSLVHTLPSPAEVTYLSASSSSSAATIPSSPEVTYLSPDGSSSGPTLPSSPEVTYLSPDGSSSAPTIPSSPEVTYLSPDGSSSEPTTPSSPATSDLSSSESSPGVMYPSSSESSDTDLSAIVREQVSSYLAERERVERSVEHVPPTGTGSSPSSLDDNNSCPDRSTNRLTDRLTDSSSAPVGRAHGIAVANVHNNDEVTRSPRRLSRDQSVNQETDTVQYNAPNPVRLSPGESPSDSLRTILNCYHQGWSDLASLFADLELWTTAQSARKERRVSVPRFNRGAMARSQRKRRRGQRRGDDGRSETRPSARYRRGAALRSRFWKDMKGTVRTITEGCASERRCEIDPQAIERKFRSDLRSLEGSVRPAMPEWMQSQKYRVRDEVVDTPTLSDEAPITALEVEAVLRTLNVGSAPGPDGLTYGFWKDLDPRGKLLADLFEICRSRRTVPDSWRRSRVTLIPKSSEGDMNDLSNWRPISICCTLYKVYASVIARRIQRWAVDGGVVSPEQKGFVPTEGVYEHVFMLDSVVADAQMRRRPLVVSYLDIRNAFGSVRHECIADVLRHFDAPDYLVRIVTDMYARGSCAVRTKRGLTAQIPVERGVRQGCPMSGIIFDLVMEVLLRGVKTSTDGYRMPIANGRLTQVMAYADDVCLVTHDKAQMSRQLLVAERFSNWSGMVFNPRKCGSVAFTSTARGGRQRDNEPLRLHGEDVRVLGVNDIYKYLGCFTTGQTPRPHTPFLQTVKEKLRLRPFTRGSLQDFDNTVRHCLKVAFRLPKRACREVFHASPEAGGLGVTSVVKEYDLLKIAQAFKMLTSPDERVATVASNSVAAYAKRFGRLSTVSANDKAAYLSGQKVGSSEVRPPGCRLAQTVWTQVRSASSRLGIRWVALPSGQLQLTDDGGFRVLPQNRRQLIRQLHHRTARWWRAQWASHPDQGKTVMAHSMYEASNAWIKRPSTLATQAYFFVLKARLNLLPTRGVYRRFSGGNHPRTCRRCGYDDETLPHVLNHCPAVWAEIKARHDSVMEEVLKHVPAWWHSGLSIDRTVREHSQAGGGALRPDVVLRIPGGPIVVSDFAVPFESGQNPLGEASARKVSKYDELCVNLHALTGRPVKALPYVVGSLGSQAEGNNTCLRALGLDRQTSNLVAKRSCALAIEGSLNIWQAWCAGIPEALRRS